MSDVNDGFSAKCNGNWSAVFVLHVTPFNISDPFHPKSSTLYLYTTDLVKFNH